MARAYIFVMMLAACCLSGVSGLGIGKKTTALKPTPNEKAVAFKVCTRSTRKPHPINMPMRERIVDASPSCMVSLVAGTPSPPRFSPVQVECCRTR
jgi:hypothetical protein